MVGACSVRVEDLPQHYLAQLLWPRLAALIVAARAT